MADEPIIGAYYTHYKNKQTYVVDAITTHADTLRPFVAYHDVKKEKQVWVRSMREFMDTINTLAYHGLRFIPVVSVGRIFQLRNDSSWRVRVTAITPGRPATVFYTPLPPTVGDEHQQPIGAFIDSYTEIDEPTEDHVVLKAYGGDRKKNLEAIADRIDGILGGTHLNVTLQFKLVHEMRGMCEQLRIIADDYEKLAKHADSVQQVIETYTKGGAATTAEVVERVATLIEKYFANSGRSA